MPKVGKVRYPNTKRGGRNAIKQAKRKELRIFWRNHSSKKRIRSS